MTEQDHNLNQEFGSKPLSYTPASFEKRVVAWVGVVYMIMLVLSLTYMISTAKILTGTAFLLLPPAAVGVAIIAIYRYRQSKSVQGRNFTLALVFLCFVALVMGLIRGIPNLLSNFGIYLTTFPVHIL